MVIATFFILFVVGSIVYWVVHSPESRKNVLWVLSYTFIALVDYRAALVLLAMTIFSHALATRIDIGGTNVLHRIGVVVLVLNLVFFRYLSFLLSAIPGISAIFSIRSTSVLNGMFVPLGISYTTFKYISYLTDIHRGTIKRGSLIDLLCYGSMFTIFIAGPIERFSSFSASLATEKKFRVEYLDDGVFRIAVGLFKKLVVADWCGYVISNYLQPYMSAHKGYFLCYLFARTLQIYFDFAGYSDIAIGSSKLFGLKIMENFDWPLIQENLAEFWRHWHISLSTWIRDYVFFPLGMRYVRSRIWILFVAPVLSMAICGLWHGAGWGYLLWGLWHGFGLSLFQVWHQFKRHHEWARRLSENRVFSAASVVITFAYVAFGFYWYGN